MTRLSSRRLIDASDTLDAADRALLNIWLNRGLDDAALAHMTGMTEQTIADRRARIVEQLSAVLGLPPDNVRSALTEIAASPELHLAAGADAAETGAAAPAANGTALAPEVAGARPGPNGGSPPELVTPSADGPARRRPGDTASAGATAAPALEPDTGSSSRRRRWLWNALALFVIVIAVVLVISLASGGSGHHRGPARASTQTVPPTSPTSPSPSPTVSRPPGEPLVPLSGGADHPTGTVQITGTGPHLKLYLSVSNLPVASHGHYEIWLYDSIVYAEALGRLPTGVSHVSLPLPRNADRFHSVDISFQPVGLVFHSGESVLRSVNPLFAKATARRP